MSSSTKHDTHALIRNMGLAERVLHTQNERNGRRYKIILLYNRDDNTAEEVADAVTDLINRDIGEVMDYLPLGGFIILETVEAIVDSEVVIFLICQDFMKRGEYNLYRNMVYKFGKPVVMLPYEVRDDLLRLKWPECSLFQVIHLKKPLCHNIDNWQQRLTGAVPKAVYRNPCSFSFLGRTTVLLGRTINFFHALFLCACSCINNERRKLEAETEALNQARTVLGVREREHKKAREVLDQERKENRKNKKALDQERKENRKNKEALDQERKENRKNKEALDQERKENRKNKEALDQERKDFEEEVRIQRERIEEENMNTKKGKEVLDQERKEFKVDARMQWARIGEGIMENNRGKKVLEQERNRNKEAKEALDQRRRHFEETVRLHWKRIEEAEEENNKTSEALDQRQRDFEERQRIWEETDRVRTLEEILEEEMRRRWIRIEEEEQKIELAEALLQRERQTTAEEIWKLEEERRAFEQERNDQEENEKMLCQGAMAHQADQHANLDVVEDSGNIGLPSFKNKMMTKQPTRSGIKKRKLRKDAGYYTRWQGVYDCDPVKVTNKNKIIEPELLSVTKKSLDLPRLKKDHDSYDTRSKLVETLRTEAEQQERFVTLSKLVETMKTEMEQQEKLEVKKAISELLFPTAINRQKKEPAQFNGNPVPKIDPMVGETDVSPDHALPDQVDRDSICEDSDSEDPYIEPQPSDGLDPTNQQPDGSWEEPLLRNSFTERQTDLKRQTTQKENESREEQAEVVSPEVNNLHESFFQTKTDDRNQDLLKNVKESDDGDDKPPERPTTKPDKLNTKESTPDEKDILEKDSETSKPNLGGHINGSLSRQQVPKAPAEITSASETGSTMSAIYDSLMSMCTG